MLDALKAMWWATLAIGIIAVIFGLIAMFLPVTALTAVVFIAAFLALLTGVFAVVGGIRGIAHDGAGWLELLWGLVGIGIGLFVIFEPKTGAVVLFLLYGIWAVLRGAVEVIAAIRLRHAMSGWVATLVAGLLWIGLGVLFLVAPAAAAVATTIVWGIIVLTIGIVTIVSAAFAHKAISQLDDDESAAAAMMQY